MTKKDAEKVLSIMNNADGGCPYCAEALFETFVDTYPEHKELARELYRKEHNRELELWEPPA